MLEGNNDSEIYIGLLKKFHGLLEVKAKFPVIDKKALALVYTPGVAAPCLEINKNIDDAYKYTNKLNNMLLVTDCSAGNFKREKWNEFAAIPYLEGISVLYKKLANIDCYPLIIKSNELKSAEEFAELIDKIMPCFSAVEFYNVDQSYIDKYNEITYKKPENSIYEKFLGSEKLSNHYLNVNSIDKQLVKTTVSIHMMYAAAIRVGLDVQAYTHLNDLVKDLIEYSNNNFKENFRIFSCMRELISFSYDWLAKKGFIHPNSGNYAIVPFKMSKDYVCRKYNEYITVGERGWVNDNPENYHSLKETNDKNALVLHQRYKGVIGTNIKVPFQSAERLIQLLSFENFEGATQLILYDPLISKDITCHSNMGAIITNGTAILGLGDIGALAGLPVMEGKSVLFKLYGGTDIVPFCIQEKDQEKFVRYASLISPIYSIYNLEDIKSPESFYIEPKLNELCDFPVFHDDQHGTAIVCLGATINALKLAKKSFSEVKVVMNGAGSAGLSVAKLLITYGAKRFIVCDTKGAIYKDRKENMNSFKQKMAEISNFDQEKGTLSEVLKGADIFIGLSTGGVLNKEMIQSMNKDPIIFALANPVPEIYPDEAYKYGAFIAATGRSDFPNQINNSMAFPGIFRAVVDISASDITMDMKIAAAEGIAKAVPADLLSFDKIVPSAMDTTVFSAVARCIAEVAEKKNLIRNKKMTPLNVEENVNTWFQEGYLRIKF